MPEESQGLANRSGPPRSPAFEVEKSAKGWRWSAYDTLGRLAGEGLAPTKAAAATRVIDTLART
jgi:hypothetical protein